MRAEWLDELRSRGLEPLCPIPPQTLVCRASRRTTAGAVSGLPFVGWLGSHPPEAKLAPELLDAEAAQDIVLSLWPDEDARALAGRLAALGVEVTGTRPGLVLGRAEPHELRALAALDPVAWIQAADKIEPFNSRAQWVIQTGWRPESPEPGGRRLWEHGIRGQGVDIGLFDTGINTDHDMFFDPEFPLSGPGVFPFHRKIAAYLLYPGAGYGDVNNYHGSGVAGTLAGNDSVNGDLSKNDGMAPDARIVFTDVAAANGTNVYDQDITELLTMTRGALGPSRPVRHASGSFGSGAGLGDYRLLDATLDAFCWEHRDFFVTWAAGNFGGGRYRIGHPACAKNALTVGASGNGTESNLIYDGSSRGPTRDDRVKPNLVAPGLAVTTVDGPGNSAYSSRTGTSFAAPAAGGGLALLRQYLRDGWFPTGSPIPGDSLPKPSSALLRALALTAADPDVARDSFPDLAAGWGRLDLDRVVHFAGDSTLESFVDDTIGIATGTFREYQFRVTASEPLRVTLAWTDSAAAPEAEIALVNDLDLDLISPDLNGYHGNRFSGDWSRLNPVDWDERNVEELVRIEAPMTGTWTVRALGRSVFTRRQPFALVVRGPIAGFPGTAEPRPGELPGSVARPALLVSRACPLRLLTDNPVELLDRGGRRVLRLLPRAGLVVWNGAGLPAGVYFYRFEPAGCRLSFGKLLLLD